MANDLATPDGEVTRIIADMARPNGLCVSADGGLLYVADSARKTIRAYELKADGSVGSGRDFAVLSEDQGTPDGMAVDVRGNLYCAAAGVLVFAPTGELLGVVEVPETASNCAFGGSDGRTLFITAGHSVYSIRLTMPGLLSG